MKLAEGYKLEEAGNEARVNEARVLKRPNGYVLATFGSGVRHKNIQRIAEADKKQLQAIKAQRKFALEADPETIAMFEQDVREARTEYLQALKAAYSK
jgi:hypothetical protein